MSFVNMDGDVSDDMYADCLISARKIFIDCIISISIGTYYVLSFACYVRYCYWDEHEMKKNILPTGNALTDMHADDSDPTINIANVTTLFILSHQGMHV